MTNRMLHERIRHQNEITREPTTECNGQGCRKMSARSESFLTPDQRTNERALQEEREHAFHRQRLSDDATGVFGKVRPVRSELKLHRNAGDDADREIESEDLGPKSDGLVVLIIAGAEGAPFPVNDEPRQPHGELRKEIVIDDREPEL